MRQRPIASPVIKIGCAACEAPPNERPASDRYPCGRPNPFASEFHAVRAAAAASAR